jgi:hypothetical protein
MELIDYTNLITGVRNNIVELIQNNIDDPAGPGREWIYSRIPETKARDFQGYPFIVIPDTEISFSKKEDRINSLDGKSRFVDWNISIDIYSSDRGHGERNDQGSTMVRNITQQILTMFLDVSIRDELRDNGLIFSDPEVTSVDTTIIEETLAYQASLNLNLQNKMQVSK